MPFRKFRAATCILPCGYVLRQVAFLNLCITGRDGYHTRSKGLPRSWPECATKGRRIATRIAKGLQSSSQISLVHRPAVPH
jgi:hypothetical protein